MLELNPMRRAVFGAATTSELEPMGRALQSGEDVLSSSSQSKRKGLKLVGFGILIGMVLTFIGAAFAGTHAASNAEIVDLRTHAASKAEIADLKAAIESKISALSTRIEQTSHNKQGMELSTMDKKLDQIYGEMSKPKVLHHRTFSGDLFITDCHNNRVQKCHANSPGSACATVVGTEGQGSGPMQLNCPHGLAIDASRDLIIVDNGNHRVQKCTDSAHGSICTTVAGTGGRGSGPTQLSDPQGVAIDASGDFLIADAGNNRVQKCPAAPLGSACTTVAGKDGRGSGLSQLNMPCGVAIDASGDVLIGDAGNNRVQKCPAKPLGSACTTVAGIGGQGSGPTQLHKPCWLTIDASGDLLIADQGNHRVQKCFAASPGSKCMTLAGRAKGFHYSQPELPSAQVIDASGDLIIVDNAVSDVKKCSVLSPGSRCAVVAGTEGQGLRPTQLDRPVGLAIVSIEEAAACNDIILIEIQGTTWIPRRVQEARAGLCETKGGCGHRPAATGHYYIVKQGGTSPIDACLRHTSGGAVSGDCYDRYSGEGRGEMWEFVNDCANLRNMATQKCLGASDVSPTPMVDCGSGLLWTKAQALSIHLTNTKECKLSGGENGWWTVRFYHAQDSGTCGLNIYRNMDCSQERFLFKGPGNCWCLRPHASDECTYLDTGVGTYSFQAPRS